MFNIQIDKFRISKNNLVCAQKFRTATQRKTSMWTSWKLEIIFFPERIYLKYSEKNEQLRQLIQH